MSRSSCVMATGLLESHWGEHKWRGAKHIDCGPGFIGLQIKAEVWAAGVWAAGDLSGSLRPCGPKDEARSQPAMRETGQPHPSDIAEL